MADASAAVARPWPIGLGVGVAATGEHEGHDPEDRGGRGQPRGDTRGKTLLRRSCRRHGDTFLKNGAQGITDISESRTMPAGDRPDGLPWAGSASTLGIRRHGDQGVSRHAQVTVVESGFVQRTTFSNSIDLVRRF